MSQENLRLVAEIVEAVKQQDAGRLVALTDPAVEWRSFFAELGKDGLYRGHEGMRQYVRDIGDAWEVVYPEVDDMLAVGTLVLVVGRIHYRGRGSGLETEAPIGLMFKIRGGLVLKFRAFRDPELVLEAAGLSE